MKTKQLLLVSILAVGLQGLAQASPYPADAEAVHNLAPLDTYSDQQARIGAADETWGASKREVQPHDAFPFGGGYIDD